MDLASLSHPELTGLRQELLDELAQVSALPDAATRLGVPAGAADELVANTRWQQEPALPAAQLYTGVLFDALNLTSLEASALRRARRDVRVFSALHGVLTLGDRVAPYRLSAGAILPTAGGVIGRWREALAPVLDQAAAGQLVVDVRSTGYRPMWRPADRSRWVMVEVPGASHHAKHTRGLVVRALAQHPGRLTRPEQLLAALPGLNPQLETSSAGHKLLVSAPQ